MISLAVLLPAPLGYHLFIRWPRDRIRRSSTIVHPADIADVLRPIGDPLVVALIGTRDADAIANQVLEFADLIAIPEAWLRRVPKRDVGARAAVAARIVSAHRKAPVRHYIGREHPQQSVFPF